MALTDMAGRSLLTLLTAFAALTQAAPAPAPSTEAIELSLTNAYAPIPADCPDTPLVRNASGISTDECDYYDSRKPIADENLAAWLTKQGSFNTTSLPSLGLTSSGGGLRALLEGAGVVQAFDSRDSDVGTSGIYQSLTYQGGLSGGAWFLGSLTGNNWPTVSSLRDNLWEPAFQNTLLLPRNLLQADEYVEIANSISLKLAAGYDLTLVDVYGRLLSYQLLYGDAAGDDIRLSTLTTYSNFTSYNVPYPIMTALGVDDSYQGGCYPGLNATQYEFHPYEYGSWDAGVAAFARTEYMGSDLTDGEPTVDGDCIVHYDNLGYVFGTSSDIFPGFCEAPTPSNDSNSDLINVLEGILTDVTGESTFQDLFGIYPNPFYKLPQSTLVNDYPLITMADGGLADQNVPIWPFIQPGRTVDVLIASDNSNDINGYPNGTEIRQTYLNAVAAGLIKMPFIPEVSVFISEGLNTRATFFGCNSTDPETMFMVWLPNVAYTYDSGQSTYRVQYSEAATDAMIGNGNAIATQNGTEGWPFCLACAVMNRDGAGLPEGCDGCFEEYCYYRSGTTA